MNYEKRKIIYILLFFLSLFLSYIITINFINIYVFKHLTFTLNFALLFFQHNLKLFVLATFFGMLPFFLFWIGKIIDSILLQNTERSKKDFNKLMSFFQAKQKYLCISFDKNGLKPTLHLRFLLIYDKYIEILNNHLPVFLKKRGMKFKTKVKYYETGGKKTPFRAGFPVLGNKKNKIYVDPTDSHSLINGTTNSGKTLSLLLPFINIVRMCGENGVIVDLKGELSQLTYDAFIRSGYKVKILDFIDPTTSDGWNPLYKAYQYYEKERKRVDALKDKLIKKYKELEREHIFKYGTDENFDPDTLMRTDENGNPNCINKKIQTYPNYSNVSEIVELVGNAICRDSVEKPDFWNDSAADLLKGLIYLLLEEDKPEIVSLATADFVHTSGSERFTKKQNEDSISYIKAYVDKFRKDTDLSFGKLNGFMNAPEDTAKSISSTFNSTVQKFILSQEVKNILAVNEDFFEGIDDQKTIIFLKVHDEKDTYYPLVNVFMQQLQASLIEKARNNPDLKLKYPFHFLWDEFGQFPKFEPIYSLLGAGRSRGIRVHLVVQGYDQLDRKYGKEGARSIKNGCMDKAYLLSDDKQTLDEFSESAGKRYVKRDGKWKEEPIFTNERLKKFQYGEILVLRQKENPFHSKMLPNNKYVYYRNEKHFFDPQPHKQARLWNIKTEYINKMQHRL